jgi:hypothetical protein
MISRKANDGIAPSPDELAAYADGELRGAARARVQAWLVGHPEAAGEVAAVRSLDRLCRAAGPSLPDEAAWAKVFQSIEQQTEQDRRRPTAAWRRLARVLIPLSGAAAILLVFLFHQAGKHQSPVAPEPVEPFPVASIDEIEIISMDDADRHALVIGKPPLSEPMVLVAAGDTSEIHIQADVDGMKPSIARPVDGATMIVAPLSSGVDEKDP